MSLPPADRDATTASGAGEALENLARCVEPEPRGPARHTNGASQRTAPPGCLGGRRRLVAAAGFLPRPG